MGKNNYSLVRQLIYDYTFYNNGENRNYLSLSSLIVLVDRISRISECPEYIRITPFYIHKRLDFQIEYDEYMCYIEFTPHQVSPNSLEEFQAACFGKKISELSREEFKQKDFQYMLLHESAVEQFHESLKKYINYMVAFMPKFYEQITTDIHAPINELFLGELCFEIHCF